MRFLKELADRIRSMGFSCTQCGACCRAESPDSNLVMVFPDEVRSIILISSLAWDAVAEPYPEQIDNEMGGKVALGWCLRRINDSCRFLKNGACSIYAARPRICRTYPFMLDGTDLKVYPCEGLGKTISYHEARQIAGALIRRRDREKDEERRVRQILWQHRIPRADFVVIDSDGIRVMDG